jgi:hypothetical protein
LAPETIRTSEYAALAAIAHKLDAANNAQI